MYRMQFINYHHLREVELNKNTVLSCLVFHNNISMLFLQFTCNTFIARRTCCWWFTAWSHSMTFEVSRRHRITSHSPFVTGGLWNIFLTKIVLMRLCILPHLFEAMPSLYVCLANAYYICLNNASMLRIRGTGGTGGISSFLQQRFV